MSTKHTNSRNSLTKHHSRTSQQVGALKALLLTGSVAATLAGTRLLALQEPAAAAVPANTTAPVMILVPAGDSSLVPLLQSNRGTRIELEPIPQVVQPRLNPVVRTRSSR